MAAFICRGGSGRPENRSAQRPDIFRRRHTGNGVELPGKLLLAGKTELFCNFPHRQRTFPQEQLALLHPDLCQIGSRRHAKLRAENPVQIGRADVRRVCELLQRNFLPRMGRDHLNQMVCDSLLRVAGCGKRLRLPAAARLLAAQKTDEQQTEQALHAVMGVFRGIVFGQHLPQQRELRSRQIEAVSRQSSAGGGGLRAKGNRQKIDRQIGVLHMPDVPSDEHQLLLPQQEVQIEADVMYLKRVLDNLFDNIRKYADPARPVAIAALLEDGALHVCLSNSVNPASGRIESNKIGLRTCAKIMAQMAGGFKRYTENGKFTAEVILPIQAETMPSE